MEVNDTRRPLRPAFGSYMPRGKWERSLEILWDFILPRVEIALYKTKASLQSSEGLISTSHRTFPPGRVTSSHSPRLSLPFHLPLSAFP